jgi:nucleoside-diphosphate-sugar epimerase
MGILKKTEFIFHLAGIITTRRKEEYIQTNVRGTEQLLKACLATRSPRKRFILMSSIAAMGAHYHESLLKESDPCHPRTEYGKSKRQSEVVALRYTRSIPLTLLRPAFIYGRGDKRGLEYLRSVLKGSASIANSIIQTASVCHVSDVVKACLLAMNESIKSGEIFIISDSKVYCWNELTSLINELMCVLPMKSTTLSSPKAEGTMEATIQISARRKEKRAAQYWGCDISKARQILQFNPSVSLRQGAADTIQWYQEQHLLD